MILLAVDTSGQVGSLALAHIDGKTPKQQKQTLWTKKAMHSEVATVHLQELLRDTNTGLRDLTHIVVNVGPGSFTGLRVGISLAKTLAYTLSLPVANLNSLEVQAFRHSQPGEKIFVAHKAVQTFYYVASLERTQTGVITRLSPRSADENELSTLAAGCSKTLVEGKSDSFSSSTEALHMLDLMAASGFSTSFLDWKAIEPLYLRASEAEEKLKKGLLKPV